jgi:hypothetical protein
VRNLVLVLCMILVPWWIFYRHDFPDLPLQDHGAGPAGMAPGDVPGRTVWYG